jgi:hypothetical protein
MASSGIAEERKYFNVGSNNNLRVQTGPMIGFRIEVEIAEAGAGDGGKTEATPTACDKLIE